MNGNSSHIMRSFFSRLTAVADLLSHIPGRND